jgi:hypothetical protein
MDCFKKNIIRLVFSSTLILLLFSVLAIGNASAAAAYRDDLPVSSYDQIVWDHTDVSGWVINSDLHKVYISGGYLNMPHTKACDWPMYDKAVNANAWVIHKSTRDGKWHANTWDFMRKCQTTKGEHDVGDPYGWRPSHGEEVYILMSGIARPGYAETIHARSNIVKYYWGSEGGTALPAVPPCTESPSISSFTADPPIIRPGKTTDLKWEVSGAEGLQLTANNDDLSAFVGTHDPDVEGVDDVPLEKTTIFTLDASNACGDATPMSVKVVVISGLPFLDSLLLF